MDIYDTWKVYKAKLEGEIVKYNDASKEGKKKAMVAHKDTAKEVLKKFIDLLKLENKSDQTAFREVIDSFMKDIKLMDNGIQNFKGTDEIN